MANNMKIGQKGLDLIKSFEGLRLTAYRDAVGILTIGYGHTGDVRVGQVITNNQANELLIKDIGWAEKAVNRLTQVPLSQGQFDALVSFVFNLGENNFRKSTLLKKLNACDFDGASNEFIKWNRAGGQVLNGLTKRRTAEKDLFLS